MLELDTERFWAEDEEAHRDNCFNSNAKQVALGIRMSGECVFAELGEEGEPWGFTPRERRIELNKRYNEKALRIVGRKLLYEEIPEERAVFPKFRDIGEVFAGEYLFDGHSIWLKGNLNTPSELEKHLDKIEKMDIETFILPSKWFNEKERIFNEFGIKPPVFSAIRGPVTLATSVFGIENLIYLMYDYPDLAERFRDVITSVILTYVRIFANEAGYDENLPRGFSFYDDNCCLLTPDLYEFFGYPILKEVFETLSPDKTDTRYQHSDSDMGHLLPVLSKLGLTGCNFGPNITVSEIRRFMPETRIDGQLAPFTFMKNDEEKILKEIIRDCEMAKEGNKRGLNLTTAGSINNGSLLSSMRLVMAAIQQYGQYDV